VGGEVESRNVEKRMSMSDEERRASLASETEDVSRDDQLFLEDAMSGVSEMGSRVPKRMAEIGEQLKGVKLDDNQRAVVDVFTGAADNTRFSVEREDGTHTIIMRQGNEGGAGTKHSVYRHYGTGIGVINADDLKLIPQILKDGAASKVNRGKTLLNVYEYTDSEGVVYKVVTEQVKGNEVFNDFYTNKKAPTSGSSNTLESARTDKAKDFDGTKVQQSSETPIGEDVNVSKGRKNAPPRPTAESVRKPVETPEQAAGEMEKNGVTIVRSADELPEGHEALRAIREGDKVTGWFDPKTGRAYVYLPGIDSVDELMRTFRHEGVAHMGLRELLGREKFSSLCEDVWNDLMTQEDRDHYMAYVSGMSDKEYKRLSKEEREKMEANAGRRRAAADEFVAFMGEDGSYREPSMWRRVVDWVRSILRRMGLKLKVTEDDVMNLLRKAEVNSNLKDEDAIKDEAGIRFRRVEDEKTLRELDEGKTVKVYRAMQKQDGKYYPPMSGKVRSTVVGKNGKARTKWEWRDPIEMGSWEMAEERPDLANEDGTFTLDKGNGTKINAAYNPYIHTSRSPINDQFSSAWKRPELVTVEVEVPESELTSGYRAERAKDAVGEVEWKSGTVSNALAKTGDPRRVILSRYDRPVREVPVSEVAEEYARRLEGKDIEVPFNTVSPELRDALARRGVKIGAPEGGNAGSAAMKAYEAWKSGEDVPGEEDLRLSKEDTEPNGEEVQIVERAKADGSYMKAPNGKPTKLSEKQWVQVRTEAFKKWFGDWEKVHRIAKLEKSKPIVLTGKEHIGKYELVRESAQRYLLDNVRGEYRIDDTGEVVAISKVGAKKVTSHSQGDVAHMQSIAAIPEMIKNAVFMEERPAYKDNAKYTSYRYYVVGLKIGGEDYTARLTIGVKGGKSYYDHYLTEIEKGNLIKAARGFKPTGDLPYPSYAEGKDTMLSSIMQVNSSKVLDENGEPMIVYHGTRNDFNSFDANRIGSNLDYGTAGMGFYFTTDRENAENIARNAEGEGEPHVMEAYLNITNPKTGVGTMELDGSEGAARKFTEKAIAKGFDGIEAESGFGVHKLQWYVAFDAKQIKSATDNGGEFSGDTSDIRFRKGDGDVSDEEVSRENDPKEKMSGESSRTRAEKKRFAERERKRMRTRAEEILKRLGIGDDVEIVDDASSFEGVRAKAKGFFDTKTGKITIILGNHASAMDVAKTVLHEAVAHYGLRRLFGKHFDTFLDNVYAYAERDVRAKIVELSKKNGWNFREATEEYLAGLAEDTNFEGMSKGLWTEIKTAFLKMMHKLGLYEYGGETLSDNELRYILWRSYKNMEEPDRYRNLFDRAEDIATQDRLKVGEYEQKDAEPGKVADGESEFVNQRFNEQLSKLTEENADNITLSLGAPTAILRSAGISAREMKLYANKIFKKMRKHGFSLEELRGLPQAVSNPIAVFNNFGREWNRSVLTELKTKDGNFLVAVTVGKDGVDADFNLVSSVFGKSDEKIVEWINRGYATYINKEKALDYLHHSASIAETLKQPELSSAAKVVESFENPSVEGVNNVKEDDISGLRFRRVTDRDMDLDRTITENSTALSDKFRENKQLKEDALSSIHGNMTHLRQAMAEQRLFDVRVVRGVADLARTLMTNGTRCRRERPTWWFPTYLRSLKLFRTTYR
jgi:ribosomal protein L21E